MKSFKLFLLSLLFFVISNSVIAETKIAFIDVQYIMENSLAGQSLKKQLENNHKKNLKDFKTKEEDLKKKEQEILKKKNILSKEEFQKEISDLRNKVKNYNEERNKKINSLTKKRLESMEKILKNLSPILTDYSKENNISIVMDKKYIIVGKTELNLTEEILKLLDNKIKKISIN